ncbi:hypothetical protein C2G38_1914012, partial [Gigaspora rosea]
GPSSIPYLQIHCWSGIEEALQKLGAKVVVTKVPRYLITHLLLRNLLFEHATPHHGSPFIDWCRDNIGVGEINQTFEEAAKKTRGHQNLNDLRSSLLESRVQEQSLRSPSQAENIKKEQPRSTIVATKTNQSFDTPAYSTGNLTTNYCINYFNKSTPNNPSVAYYSYGASTNVPIWSPLYFPYQIIKEKEGPNYGLVSVKSAQCGKYMGTVECDHWDL